MNLFHIIILGIVEGLTEFLPVSSTFHLILTSRLLGIPQTDFNKLFEVFIQSGAILAVAFLYGKTLLEDKKLASHVLISFIPTALIGFVLYKVIKGFFFEAFILNVVVFFSVGVLFLLFEVLVKKEKISLRNSLKQLTVRDALLIGLFQAVAVVPGVSRAGAVIIGMMVLKYKREEAAKYSFMLSAPTIFAASFYDLYKMRDVITQQGNSLVPLLIGSIVAFVSAVFVIKWFITYLQRHSLSLFGWYRIILALILLTLTTM